MRVLIIDDDLDKVRAVATTIAATGLCEVDSIEDVRDATAAKRMLQSTYYDLVVLDIALPLRIDEDISPRGGLGLLAEIVSRPNYKIPGQIVGLTQVEEILSEATEEFGNYLWTVVFYDRASTRWSELLSSLVRRVAASLAARAANLSYDYDVGVICALDDPELQAVRRLPWSWTAEDRGEDATQFFVGSFESSGQRRRVVAAASPAMGCASAAAISMKLIMRYRPQHLVHVGVLAGTTGSVAQGDIVVGNLVWDWGSGKHVDDGNQTVFQTAPQQFGIRPGVRAVVEEFQRDTKLLAAIRDEWPGIKPATALSVHIGPIASGSSVVASAEVFDKVKLQHRKLLGIEMEAFGVLSAVEVAPHPQPHGLIIKSVQDFGDAVKNDSFRHYAAYTAARALGSIAPKLTLR